MNRHAAVVAILITLLIAGCSTLSAQDEPKTAPKPEVNQPNWYKIDITLNEFEDGKKTNTRAYTLNAEANGARSEMKLGDRVPVATGAFAAGGDENKLVNTQFQYIDVGLNISCSVAERGGRLGLNVSADQSSVSIAGQNSLGDAQQQLRERLLVKQPVIRQLRMENRTAVTLGKPMLVASVDDPGRANHKYTIEATVTKLTP